ncbi:hypothetical protein LRS10_09570 [Phenylobacterium sp. J426]|uniref:hypothetical protein n=1 Tax=Phenylobacterium sp. J426 TaxID=2898439 RepID=UPI0021512337|nr:hypothetical protein [Phenylobacterium sp. J426]MCR5874391.1 hypothetical protein [Phenylobacterium sp. J426]
MRDPLIKRACPFCGEAEHLRIHDAAITRPIVEGADTRKGPDGQEEMEAVDAVACDVCDAMAPLDVWNGERSAADYTVLRDFDEQDASRPGATASHLAGRADDDWWERLSEADRAWYTTTPRRHEVYHLVSSVAAVLSTLCEASGSAEATRRMEHLAGKLAKAPGIMS